ncbi:hypothetical protein INT47_008419 [Mucor saturninus]|uniref:Aminotransferase class V domain-containing protein n=1 Tax=Mucor saturninus TaxID=64648 RepID=A0A8H7RAK2_9FUNG|nr:hypothetical protein INT47_008419 [Mucor saturninus]
MTTDFGKKFRKDFSFEADYVPINHGSYGTYPNVIKPVMREFQDKAEQHPDRWNRFESKEIIKSNLKRLSKLVHCDDSDLIFVPNASSGVNTVLRSFPFKKGDKILHYQTVYASVDKTLAFLKDHYQVELVRIHLNYPLEDAEIIQLTKEAIDQEHAKGNGKIRMAVFDALSSLPGVRFPFEAINSVVQENGILSLIDGAHAIGQVSLNLTELNPDYFITNCHKWLYSPRGCAILYAPKRNQGFIHPTTINAAYKFHADSTEYSSFAQENVPNTIDTAPYLCIDAALNYRESIGGEEAICKYTHDIAVKGGALVAKLLGTQVMENSTKTLTANMVNIELPAFKTSKTDPEIMAFFLNKSIYEKHTMLSIYKNNSKWWVRLCGQIYVDLDDFQKAGEAVLAIIKEIDEQ